MLNFNSLFLEIRSVNPRGGSHKKKKKNRIVEATDYVRDPR